MPHRTLSLDEVADYLHLRREDVERLVKTTDMPHTIRGGRPMFLRGDIDAWASCRILGLPDRRLTAFHEQTTSRLREIREGDALMPELMRTEYIDLNLSSRTKPAVIRDMVDFASRVGHVNDSKALLESVIAREELCSTALPGGMALLHARHHDEFLCDHSFLLLGRTIATIPFGASDGGHTRLFFLLCCQDDRLHLHTLARLCMMAAKTDLLAQLWHAPDADSAHAILGECEQTTLLGRAPAEAETS
jgi:mannitol/fructose-specific phosphotransferase system IIA component (Ntr-type)